MSDQATESTPTYGLHTTNPIVTDAGELTCTVCGQVMMILAPEAMEHNTDTPGYTGDESGEPDEG